MPGTSCFAMIGASNAETSFAAGLVADAVAGAPSALTGTSSRIVREMLSTMANVNFKRWLPVGVLLHPRMYDCPQLEHADPPDVREVPRMCHRLRRQRRRQCAGGGGSRALVEHHLP